MVDIVKVAGKYSGIPPERIISKVRKKEVAELRKMILAILKEQQVTHEVIADTVGYSGHAVVTHMVKSHKNLMDTDTEYNKEFSKFREYCREQIPELQEEPQVSRVTITKATISGILKMLKGHTVEEYKRVAEVYGIHQTTVQKIANGTYTTKRLQV